MSHSVNITYVDGLFVRADQAVIPVDDLAVLRGYGIFDLLRTYEGKPLFLDDHIDRLLRSAEQVGLSLPWSKPDLVGIVLETLARNAGPGEFNIRILVTGGSSPDFMTPTGKPRLIVMVSPRPVLPASWYSDGVKIVSVKTGRRVPGAKSTDYLTATMALQDAKKQGAVEALYVGRDGIVSECTTSNIFAFFGSRLTTPGDRILSGVTRKVVLDLAADRFEIDVRDITLQELTAADEVFITGTNKGLVPVVGIDEAAIGTGRPGENTRRLMAMLKAHTETLAAAF